PTNNPGPMSIEVLAATLHATAIPANRTGGTNFAVSGAKNIDRNTTTDGFPNAIPTATQINNFLATHTIAGSDVFVIGSGAHDVAYALPLASSERPPSLQRGAVALPNSIKLLQTRGATHIIVTNQPQDFGDTDKQNARRSYNTALLASLVGDGVS